MGFLDKKKRTMDITLTSYGRECLSKGILDPKYFVISDFEVQYASSSEDFTIETLPVIESFSDNIDMFMENRVIDASPFKAVYPNITLVSTSSLRVIRVTDESADTDPILSSAISFDDSFISIRGITSRVASLGSRGTINDISSSIAFNRYKTDKKPLYLVVVEVSSSDQRYPLLVSGSSFGISDDNTDAFNKSSEINIGRTFYPIVNIK